MESASQRGPSLPQDRARPAAPLLNVSALQRCQRPLPWSSSERQQTQCHAQQSSAERTHPPPGCPWQSPCKHHVRAGPHRIGGCQAAPKGSCTLAKLACSRHEGQSAASAARHRGPRPSVLGIAGREPSEAACSRVACLPHPPPSERRNSLVGHVEEGHQALGDDDVGDARPLLLGGVHAGGVVRAACRQCGAGPPGWRGGCAVPPPNSASQTLAQRGACTGRPQRSRGSGPAPHGPACRAAR